MEKPVKFAVIGLGHIGKRHAEMIRRDPGAELVAVCDLLSKDQTGFEGEEPYFASLDQLLEQSPEFEVLNICTPNGLHHPMAIQALKAYKHVVTEKPMALSKANCEAMIHTALQMQRQVFVVMQNRYSPPSGLLKQMVTDGVLGEIFMVQIDCYWNRDARYYKPGSWKGSPDLDGGVLFTQFSHFIDIMYWIFGDIRNIQGKFANFSHQGITPFEDTGMVNFEFVNGGFGAFNYSTSIWDKNFESTITVIGSNGTIKIGGQYMDKVAYCHVKDFILPALPETNPANNYGAYTGSANNHHFMIRNVVDTLNGKTSPSTNALEGMKVVEIIERIIRHQSGTSRD